MNDEQLMQAFYAGKPAALDALAEKYDPILIEFVRRVLGDLEQAQQRVDEVWTMVELSRREPRKRYDPARGPVWSWLMALAGHRAWVALP
jgi:hypothetical protein